jgi:hypothetical protein
MTKVSNRFGMDTDTVGRKRVQSRTRSSLITLSKRHPGMSRVVNKLGSDEAGWSRW